MYSFFSPLAETVYNSIKGSFGREGGDFIYYQLASHQPMIMMHTAKHKQEIIIKKNGKVWYILVRNGMVWYDMILYDMVWYIWYVTVKERDILGCWHGEAISVLSLICLLLFVRRILSSYHNRFIQS